MQANHPPVLPPVTQAIHEKNELFQQAMAEGNAAAIAENCYCGDAEFMVPGTFAYCGTQAIQTALAGYIQQGFTKYTILSTNIFGERGYVGVQSHYLLSKADGSDEDNGKAIQLWKIENGSWKIFRDCFNSNLTQ